MHNHRYIILLLVFFGFCSCAGPQLSFVDRSMNVLEIDEINETYQINGNIKKITSCETNDFNCFILEDIGPIAMVKNCVNHSISFSVMGVQGSFHLYAPAPHLSSPAGSFYNNKNLGVRYHFNRNDGLYQIDINKYKANKSIANNDSKVEKYSVKSNNGKKIFDCKDTSNLIIY